MAIKNSNLRGALMALVAFAIYSTHDVVVKFLGGLYSPVQIIFFSTLLAFPLVTLMLIQDRRDGNLRPKHPWWSLARTVCTVITGLSAFYAFSVLPLAQTYAILFAAPLLITILAIPVLGERVGIRRGLAVAVGLCGVMVVLRPGQSSLQLGHFAALTAAVASSVASIIVRKIGQDERSAVLILYPMLANFVVLGLALPFVYRPMPIEHVGMLAIIASFSFVASLLVITAYRAAQAVIVAPMQYSQIIWAAIYGAIFFSERPDLYTGVGAAIIIASGIYIVLRESGGKVETQRPVLESKSRPETGIMPRISLILARVTTRDIAD